MTGMHRTDYDAVQEMARSSGVTLREVRIELENTLVGGGMNFANARALTALFQALSIDAGIVE